VAARGVTALQSFSVFSDQSSSVLQCIALQCVVLQCAAVCCSKLQCVALRCIALQSFYGGKDQPSSVAVSCSVFKCVAARDSLSLYLKTSVMKCVASCCSVFQCVAVTVFLYI